MRTRVTLESRRTQGLASIHLGNGRNHTYSLGRIKREPARESRTQRAPAAHPALTRRGWTRHPATPRESAPRRSGPPTLGGATGVSGCEFVRAKAGYRPEARARGPPRGPGPQARRLQVRGSGGTLAWTCSRRRRSGSGYAECAAPQPKERPEWSRAGSGEKEGTEGGERLFLRVSQERG